MTKSRVLTCEDREHERPKAIPLAVWPAPEGEDPRTVSAAASIEHARVTIRVGNGIMQSSSIPNAELFHLFVRENFPNSWDETAKRLTIPIVLHATLPKIRSRAVKVALDFFTRHECNLV